MRLLYQSIYGKSNKAHVCQADGAVHLMLGVAASRIKSVRTFRFCPMCMERQLHTYGEYYWQRDWFYLGYRYALSMVV